MSTAVCKDREWGYVAYNVPDPPKCIRRCRQRFLEALMEDHQSRSSSDGKNGALWQACQLLSGRDTPKGPQLPRHDHDALWDLYCCDAQSCGVDNLAGSGEDPNVNWLINSCANVGFTSISDPGPPESPFTCLHEAVFGDDPRCVRRKILPLSEQKDKDEVDPSTAVFLTSTINTSSEGNAATTTATATSGTTRAFTSDRTTLLPTHGFDLGSSSSSSQHEDSLSAGAKIVISVAIVIGLFLVATLVFCIWCVLSRRRRSVKQARAKDRESAQQHGTQPSQTTTITTATAITPPRSLHSGDNSSLSPPLRLQDRKILSPSLASDRGSSSTPRSPTRGSGFPQSPLYAPMRAKLVPRREEMRATLGSAATPLLSGLSWPREDGSIKSGKSSGTAASSCHSSRGTMRNAGSRRQDISHIRAFGSPGPAPDKQLPPTPLLGSPSSSIFPSRPGAGHGDVGVAFGVVTKNPATGVTLEPSSRELCEMTEAYHRETRDSSGSWSGCGGGGPGVVMGGSPKAADATGQRQEALKEEDLRKMGGQYGRFA